MTTGRVGVGFDSLIPVPVKDGAGLGSGFLKMSLKF